MSDQQSADLFLEEVAFAEHRRQEAIQQAEAVFDEMSKTDSSKAGAYRTVGVMAADQQFQRDLAALRTKHARTDPTIGNRT